MREKGLKLTLSVVHTHVSDPSTLFFHPVSVESIFLNLKQNNFTLDSTDPCTLYGIIMLIHYTSCCRPCYFNLRVSLLNLLPLVAHYFEAVGHTLLELRKGSDAQLLLDLCQLCLLLYQLVMQYQNFILELR